MFCTDCICSYNLAFIVVTIMLKIIKNYGKVISAVDEPFNIKETNKMIKHKSH